MNLTDEIKDHILDSIGEGVFTVDKSFKINYFNKAAEKITGWEKEEVLGNFCKHVFRSDLCYIECPIAQVLKSNNNIFDFESRIYTKFGKFLPIRLNSSVLFNKDGDPSGGIITFRDISDLQKFRKSFEKVTQFHGIIGQSKQMKDIFGLIEEISDSNAPVFIHGESGTGKELIADAIQVTSKRKEKPFVKINCSVFPPTLLASELFGHVKGSFTDAINNRQGRFEIADKGTIFLDEVAEMPVQMQLQLLRVLQEGTFEKVGESGTRKVDVRVIAATNIDINYALKTGKFREDLFYRLNVIPIEVVPLRERIEDIYPLVKHLLEKFSLHYKKEIKEIDEKVLDIFVNYHWPGNVRELENMIEFAFVRTAENQPIEKSKLPASIKNFQPRKGERPNHNSSIEDFSPEKSDLLMILEKHKWNKSTVAKELGIGRTTLWRKMKKYGLDD